MDNHRTTNDQILDAATAFKPVVANETHASQSDGEFPVVTKKKTVKIFGHTINGPLGSGLRSVQNFATRWRKGAIEKAPLIMVNYSSNIMGMIQLAAEAFMFSSSGINLVDKENRSKPLHYLTDPPKNILDTVFKKGGLGTHPLQKEFYTKLPERLAALPKRLAKLPEQMATIPSRIVKLPETIKSGISRLNDTGAATLRDRVNYLGEVQKMTNKWSARSSFAGLCAWSLVAVLPSKKDTQEETEKNVVLSRKNPIAYVAKRFYQGINPLEWWNHKRQLGGLGALCSGIFSFVSGFRQVAGKEVGYQIYMKNPWQILGGAITATSGAILMLAIDNDSGYRNFGTMQLLRTFTLPNAIMTRFKGIDKDKAIALGKPLGVDMAYGLNMALDKKVKEQGAAQYLIGSALLNGKNIFAASLAGAEKREDGTIVDHQAMREEAREKHDLAKQSQKAKKNLKSDHQEEKVFVSMKDPNPQPPAVHGEKQSPTTSVTELGKAQKAMPEREAEMLAADY